MTFDFSVARALWPEKNFLETSVCVRGGGGRERLIAYVMNCFHFVVVEPFPNFPGMITIAAVCPLQSTTFLWRRQSPLLATCQFSTSTLRSRWATSQCLKNDRNCAFGHHEIPFLTLPQKLWNQQGYPRPNSVTNLLGKKSYWSFCLSIFSRYSA